MKLHVIVASFILSFMSGIISAQTEKINDHDCLNSLSQDFRTASTAENTLVYVGVWPSTGLCHGLLIKSPIIVDGKVSIVYAYGTDPRWAKAGEINAEGVISNGELVASLPRGIKVRYILSEGKAFYTNRQGTFEGYISSRMSPDKSETFKK